MLLNVNYLESFIFVVIKEKKKSLPQSDVIESTHTHLHN